MDKQTNLTTVKVVSNRLSVKQCPNIDGEIVRTVSQGDTLEKIADYNEDWILVPDGFVMKEFVS